MRIAGERESTVLYAASCCIYRSKREVNSLVALVVAATREYGTTERNAQVAVTLFFL